MVKRGLLLITLLLCSCNSHSEQEQRITAVFQHVEENNSHKEWKLANYIGIMQHDALKRLQISYNVEKAPTVDEARLLLIEGVSQMLKTEDLKDFSYRDLKYSLAFKTADGRFVEDKAIAHAYLFNGIVYYSIFKGHGLEVCEQEDYLDAVAKAGAAL